MAAVSSPAVNPRVKPEDDDLCFSLTASRQRHNRTAGRMLANTKSRVTIPIRPPRFIARFQSNGMPVSVSGRETG